MGSTSSSYRLWCINKFKWLFCFQPPDGADGRCGRREQAVCPGDTVFSWVPCGAADCWPEWTDGGQWKDGSCCNRETMEWWEAGWWGDNGSTPSLTHPKRQGDVREHSGGVLWYFGVSQGRYRHDVLLDKVSLWGTRQRHRDCGTPGGKSVTPHTGPVKREGWSHDPWRHWRGDPVYGDLDFPIHGWWGREHEVGYLGKGSSSQEIWTGALQRGGHDPPQEVSPATSGG